MLETIGLVLDSGRRAGIRTETAARDAFPPGAHARESWGSRRQAL